MLCTLLAGLMLIAAGVLRVGTLMKYIPKPVITGFTAGIAVSIFSSQVEGSAGPLDGQGAGRILRALVGLRASTSRALQRSAARASLAASLAIIIVVRRCAADVARLPDRGDRRRARGCALSHLPVETIGTRFGGIPARCRRFALPHIPDRAHARAVSERVHDRLPRRRRIAAVRGRRGRHDRRPSPLELRAGRARRRQRRLGAVRRAAGDRRARAHRDQRARRRALAGGRHAARAVPAAVHAACWRR